MFDEKHLTLSSLFYAQTSWWMRANSPYVVLIHEVNILLDDRDIRYPKKSGFSGDISDVLWVRIPHWHIKNEF